MTEEAVAGETTSRWFIDLEWYERSRRSFSTLAGRSLCPKCRKRLKEGKLAAKELLSVIKDCCAKSGDFMPESLPVMEAVFRLFLANGNQPLGLEKIAEELRERRGGGCYPASPQVLLRLLQSDRYYGLKQAPG